MRSLDNVLLQGAEDSQKRRSDTWRMPSESGCPLEPDAVAMCESDATHLKVRIKADAKAIWNFLMVDEHHVGSHSIDRAATKSV